MRRPAALFLVLFACSPRDEADDPAPTHDAVGDSDTDEIPAPTWYEDRDGDGLGGDVSHEASDPEDDWVATTGDCDDRDASIGAPTVWYADLDSDGYAGSDKTAAACAAPDGYRAEAKDCDDADRAVYPGAPPICGDGIANDCDGPPDPETGCGFEGAHDVSNARWRWTGPADSALGFAVGAADVDGDGDVEILAGAPSEQHDLSNHWREGSVYALETSAPAGPVEAVASSEWFGTEQATSQVTGAGSGSLGDLDGDGDEEVLVASGGHGYVVSHYAPGASAIRSAASADFAFQTGSGVFTSVPARDEPGVTLVALAAWEEDWIGRVRIYRTPLEGTLTGPDAWMTIEAEDRYGLGYSVSAFDGDGDGLPGVAYVDADVYSGCTTDVFVSETFLPGTHRAVDVADVHLTTCTAFVKAVDSAGDVNADGYEDLLVGTNGTNTPDHVFPYFGLLFLGPLPTGEPLVAEDAASAVWSSDLTDGGVPVEGGGDLDGDGFDDVVINATNWDGASSHYGDLHVHYGPLEGALDLQDDAGATFYDSRYTRLALNEMEFIGDVDKDGRDDLLVGAPNWGPAGEYSYGAVYLILGGEVF